MDCQLKNKNVNHKFDNKVDPLANYINSGMKKGKNINIGQTQSGHGVPCVTLLSG